ncbi:acyl carrier protein [Prochlorococcus sp. MIT 1223]|uniref:acyl carrier protein n=1 Tax=Prochlorococcus sp. MIT 1223 TaxID=3096217 RepID=UPI002A758747|nr:acyl carrier protein [Prochlorococcus sp. MIT 1223]
MLIASVINVEAKEIGINSSPDDFPNWDSFKHMELILAIEERFSIKFTDKQITSIKNVKDICKVLS